MFKPRVDLNLCVSKTGMSDRTPSVTPGVTAERTDGATLGATPNCTSNGTARETYGGNTDDDTDESDEGTDSEEPEEEVETEYSPPCRVAAKYLTNCPQCGRRVSIRTLRYTHLCGRTFRADERALEQQEVADAKFLLRIAAAKQVASHTGGTKSAMLSAGVRTEFDIGAQPSGASRGQRGKFSMLR